MPTDIDIPLRCRCGKVRGVARASRETANHAVCYCDDCQAFARFLERDDVLDEWGGSDIFQVSPSQLTITDGISNVQCVRLSPKGLYRWYAGCCKTPIGNTVKPAIPFVGIVHAFVDRDAGPRVLEDAVGPPSAYIHGRFAVGNPPPHVHPKASLGAIAAMARLLLKWKLGGKGRPTPFFDAKGQPIVTPRVLTKAERDALTSSRAPRAPSESAPTA